MDIVVRLLKAVEQALVCVGEIGIRVGTEDHFQSPGSILSNSSSIIKLDAARVASHLLRFSESAIELHPSRLAFP